MNSTVGLALPDLVALVERATLAPSPHNSQPWRWVVHDGDARSASFAELELVGDCDRALPVGDPAGRELVMACGAALLTFRVAAAHAFLGVRVDPLPDPRRPELLARIRLVEDVVDAGFAALDGSVPLRRTWRGPLGPDPVPREVTDRLVAEAAIEGAELFTLPDALREDVARLVAEADVARGADERWRAEQASWLRPRWSRDGVSMPLGAGLPTRLALRYLDLGGYVGAQDAALVRSAPLLLVLATEHEDRASWLAAGQALQRVLLVAAEHGFAVGFTNSACQDPQRRAELRALLGGDLHPQFVLRVGRRPGAASRRRLLERSLRQRLGGVPAARRRPVREVVDLGGVTPGDALAHRGVPGTSGLAHEVGGCEDVLG